MKNKGSAYALFERKIFFSFIGIGAFCTAVVIFFRSSVRGSLGEMIVRWMEDVLYLDREHAISLYDIVIRRNLTLIIIGTIIVLLLVAFRVLLHWITRYFNEINGGLDVLIGQNRDNIQLSREMWVMEAKMNRCKEILRQREEDARIAEQRKNDLVVYLAHDVRTPLTSVIGYLDLLAQHPELTPEERQKYTDLAAGKAARLEELIQEMFEVTKYNLQEIKLQKKACNLTFMLEQMAEEFYPQMLKKRLMIRVQTETRVVIQADPDKLARVFHNIIKNAIAYGREDSTIEILIEEQQDGVMLCFRNQSEPIPEEVLQKLFDKFYRMDASRQTETGNSGLGLAIAKEIVEAHGGTIQAVSEDEIIEFIVWLPQEN